MGRRVSIGILWALLALAPPTWGQDGAQAQTADQAAGPTQGPGCILRVEIDGVISSGTASFLADAVGSTEREGCQALLVVLDTPGGHLDATRDIARTFLNATVPIVVYVAPSGARAGSAGAFITMAAHLAVMAPGSNIGAAHPVTAGGGDPEQSGGEHMGRKIESDTAAFARSIAEQRGRNVEWAESAVVESKSITATEAEEQNVVDHVVESEQRLLRLLDGRTVDGGGWQRTLRTDGVAVVDFEPTIQQRALGILGDPNLAYLLMMLGFLGLMIELYQPGMIVPGAVGVFCLLLAGIGMNALPVQAGGVVLLVVALALFVAELFVASYGFLTMGGVVSLLIGSALLIDTRDPDFYVDASVRLSWAAVIPLATVLGFGAGLLAWKAREARRRRQTVGKEGLIGERGRSEGGVGPDGGHVHVHGERWNAVAQVSIEDGAPVTVTGVDGLRLDVEPAPGDGED